MFDFSRITDAISSFMSSPAGSHAGESGAAPQLLEDLGIDPALLDGLNQGEILGLLEQHGIDPAQLGGDQLAELFQHAGAAQPLIDAAQSWLEQHQR